MPGIYVSYPFCAQKCTYCNFASGVFSRDLERTYLDAISKEIESQDWRWRPETVYLGGGTPSRLEFDDLDRILSRIPGRPWREATLEVAPGCITNPRASDWLRAGIDRVSLGVQSFIARELVRTGRKHTAEIVAAEMGALREAGLSNINIDLIAGLPGQTIASWTESLTWIERLETPHVSVYMLEIDEDSRLGNEVVLHGKGYGPPDIPTAESIAGMVVSATRELRR